MMGSPDHAAQPPALQTPEPVDQQLVITIAQVCHILHQMTIIYVNFILNKLFEYDKESSRPLYNDMKSLYFPEARGRTRCRLTEPKRLGFGGGSAEPGHCPFWKNVFD